MNVYICMFLFWFEGIEAFWKQYAGIQHVLLRAKCTEGYNTWSENISVLFSHDTTIQGSGISWIEIRD